MEALIGLIITVISLICGYLIRKEKTDIRQTNEINQLNKNLTELSATVKNKFEKYDLDSNNLKLLDQKSDRTHNLLEDKIAHDDVMRSTDIDDRQKMFMGVTDALIELKEVIAELKGETKSFASIIREFSKDKKEMKKEIADLKIDVGILKGK